MTFAVAFLGSLFAIVASLAIVYSYITLRLVPRIKRSFTEMVSEMGAKALMDQAGIDPREVAGRSDLDAARLLEQIGTRMPPPGRDLYPFALAPAPEYSFVCTQHGRCDGCPEIRDTFEAIARCQGVETMSPLELAMLTHMRAAFPKDPGSSTEVRS